MYGSGALLKTRASGPSHVHKDPMVLLDLQKVSHVHKDPMALLKLQKVSHVHEDLMVSLDLLRVIPPIMIKIQI